MTSQVLPFDILLLIIEIASLPTAAKMARTCHTLHQSGARFLLNGGVALTSGDSITSLLQFLSADAVNRFQYLRTLELACGEIPPQNVYSLLGLISHPSLALNSLTLREAESMLKSMPTVLAGNPPDHLSLVAAIARLTTIRHLTIHGHCAYYACRLIITIRSPLKTVSVDFAPLGRGLRVEDIQRRNPILILASHSSTLEEISGSYFAMLPGDRVFDTVYPSVHTIKATFSNIFPTTLPYIAAFPNLTHLSLTTPVSSSRQGSDVSSRLERALQRRLWQRKIQENHALRRTWTKLEELEGGLTDILALGLLPCHVPMLRLTGTLSEKPEYDHVKILLEDIRPTTLAIIMHVADASTFGDTMGPVFSDPSAQQLRALEVELVFSASKGDVDIQMVLVRWRPVVTLPRR